MFIVEPRYSHQFKCFTKTNAHCRHNGGPEHISLLALCLEELQEASRGSSQLQGSRCPSTNKKQQKTQAPEVYKGELEHIALSTLCLVLLTCFCGQLPDINKIISFLIYTWSSWISVFWDPERRATSSCNS